MARRVLLSELYREVRKEMIEAKLNEDLSSIYEEVLLFQELADPNFAYDYVESNPDEWEFKDRFNNRVGVRYIPENRYFESYYIMKDLDGNEVRVYDYNRNKDNIDPTSFQGSSDQNRSDTICKILRDEVIPRHLINRKPSMIKLHPLNEYRHKIFMKCAEVCQEKYPQLEIKVIGADIMLINK